MSEDKLDAFVRRNLQPPHISRARQERVLNAALGRLSARSPDLKDNIDAATRGGIVRRFAVPIGSALVLGIAMGLIVPAAPQNDTLSGLLLNSHTTTVLGF